MYRILLFLLTSLVVTTGACLAAGEWAGTWDAHLRGGRVQLSLEQAGDRVTGQYPLYNGRIEAKAQGRQLEGRWIEGKQSGSFIFVLSRDGRSFAGRYDNGEWWSGERTRRPGISRIIDLKSPRNAFTNFVVAGNVARNGIDDAWGVAATSVDFGAAGGQMTRIEQLDSVRNLFGLIDLTTFRLWSVPDNPAATSVDVLLEQSQSDANLTLTMRRDDEGNWRIRLPTKLEMAAARKALLAIHGGKPPAADAFRRLQNPRDTMRAFLEGMADWEGDGRVLALSALDLSGIPTLLHDSQGALVAQYLRHSLDHIGLVGLQSIPPLNAIKCL